MQPYVQTLKFYFSLPPEINIANEAIKMGYN